MVQEMIGMYVLPMKPSGGAAPDIDYLPQVQMPAPRPESSTGVVTPPPSAANSMFAPDAASSSLQPAVQNLDEFQAKNDASQYDWWVNLFSQSKSKSE
jgi:hypothetical protein